MIEDSVIFASCMGRRGVLSWGIYSKTKYAVVSNLSVLCIISDMA